MTQRKALGRGLESLMGSPEVVKMPFDIAQGKPEVRSHPTTVPIDKIFPNRSQPRERFGSEALRDLTESIRREGILQPLVVSPSFDGRFELIAGERRWRAAKQAGLGEVPVIIRNVHEDKMLELALIENIQREDLNPIEEAKGYWALQERFGMNHADIAEHVGKSREHVTNTLRLLNLPKAIQEDVALGTVSAGHARGLLSLPSKEEQLYFRSKIVRETLSVRDVERMIQSRGGKKLKSRRKMHLPDQMKLLIDEMEKALATKIRLQPSTKEGDGKIIVDYYSWQDLDRIYRKIIGEKGGEAKWEKTAEAG